MSKAAAVAAYAAFFLGPVIAGALPAAAGEWRYAYADEVVEVYPDDGFAPWYRQPPWIGTGPGLYYSRHPRHIPAYPEVLTGYPVPIYDTSRSVVPVARGHRVAVSSHEEWCAARYRSYDARTDSFQPYHGPRRECRSPYR